MSWSGGCVRRRNLSYQEDVFLEYSGIKLPDARNSWHNDTMNLDECRAECLNKCSCMGFTHLDIRRRSGCLIWFDGLIDIRRLSFEGQVIHIRMASSEASKNSNVAYIYVYKSISEVRARIKASIS
ncbi:hypothetical protein ACS0TY_019932 [Phlomoides rotata]